MQENGRAEPVLLVLAGSGLRVCRPHDQKSVRMSHALRRISYATCCSGAAAGRGGAAAGRDTRGVFAFVSRPPRAPGQHYCHAFATATPEQAEELSALVGDACRMASAPPRAPPWSGALSGALSGAPGARRGLGARAPASLPGLQRHYPRPADRPGACDGGGGGGARSPEPSPSSSEGSGAGAGLGAYRRLGERAPLMRRLMGALLPSDDDSTPLVADSPSTPLHPPLTNGYVNEASDAEQRTRDSNRAPPPAAAAGAGAGGLHTPPGGAGRGAPSPGAGSAGSGNNNEPGLLHAPWFQAGIPREIALEVLAARPEGSFLVRSSSSQAGRLALSVRVPRAFQPGGIAHYLILRTPKGYKIKGFTKEFTTLSALVTHHSVMPELLPCALRRDPAPARDPAPPRH